MRRGFFRPAECPRKLALRSCYDYVLGLWGLNEGRGCGGYVSRSLFRGFAAKPRASLGVEGDLVVAAFCPFAAKRAAGISRLFLLMDEKPLVFAGVHTRLVSA